MSKKFSGLKKLIFSYLAFQILATPTLFAEGLNITSYWSGPFRSSYHFNRKEKVNEENGIWGVGFHPNNNWELYWKRCINSHTRLTNWIGAKRNFYSSENFDLDFEIFMADGYPQNDLKFAPGAAFVGKFKKGPWSFNLHYPPTLEERNQVLIWDFGYGSKF